MHPNDSILFSKRACWTNSAVIFAVAMLVTTLIGLDSLYRAPFYFVLGCCLFLHYTGWAFGWFCNRVVITRLKLRYPNKAREIEDYRFGRGMGGADVRFSSVIQEEDMLPFVADDPDKAQMLSERKTLERFSLAWRWGGAGLGFLIWLVGTIVQEASL